MQQCYWASAEWKRARRTWLLSKKSGTTSVHLAEEALPSPVNAWKRGNGGAIRAYAESTLVGQGYEVGSTSESAAWAEKMFSAWFKLLKNDPIADIESAVAERLSADEASLTEQGGE